MAEEQPKILVLAPENIGDLILATPLVQALRSNFPRSFISLVVSPRNCSVLEKSPLLNEILTFDFSWNGLKKFRFVQALRKRSFDYLFCLPAATKFYLLSGLIKAKKKIGYYYQVMWVGRLASRLFLDQRICCLDDRRQNHNSNLKHETLEYLGILKSLNLPSQEPQIQITLSPEAELWAKDFLSGFEILASDSLLGLQMNMEMFKDKAEWDKLLSGIQAALPEFKVVLFAYSLKEKALAEKLDSQVLVSRDLSFARWAALVKKCKLFLGFDGGAVHLASALKIPVAVVFSEKDFDFNTRKWYPWGVNYKLLKKDKNLPAETFVAEIIKALAELKGETLLEKV